MPGLPGHHRGRPAPVSGTPRRNPCPRIRPSLITISDKGRAKLSRSVRRTLGRRLWATGGHRVVRGFPSGRPYRVMGRHRDLVYQVDLRHAAMWTNRVSSDAISFGTYASEVLAVLEGPDGDPDAARAILSLAGEEGARRAAACFVRWHLGEARVLGGPGGEALMREILAATPTLNLRAGTDRLDPIGWARRLLGPLDMPVTDARVRRLLACPDVKDRISLTAALALPEDWTPRSADDWAALMHVARIVGGPRCDGESSLPLLMGSFGLLSASRGRWREYARRFPGKERVWREELGDALDMAMAFANDVAIPLLFRAGLADEMRTERATAPATAVAARILFGDKSLLAILESSRRWHDRGFPDADGSTWTGGPGAAWPVPFEALVAPNGTRLAALGNGAELASEGQAQRHCVGDYADRCRAGSSVIVSLRDADGDRLSTLELQRTPKHPDRFALTQHRAQRNEPPSPEAVEAATWLMEALDAGYVPVSKEFLRHGWAGTSGLCEFDPMDDARMAASVARWAPYLPRPLRGMDPLVDETGGMATLGLTWTPSPSPDRKRAHLLRGLSASLRIALRHRLGLPARRRAAVAAAYGSVVALAFAACLAVGAVPGIPTWASLGASIVAAFCVEPALGVVRDCPAMRRHRLRSWRGRADAATPRTYAPDLARPRGAG
jgi:hypothetical protein